MQVTTGYIKNAYYGGNATYGNTTTPYNNRGVATNAPASPSQSSSGYPEDTVTISAMGMALYAAQTQAASDASQLALSPGTMDEKVLRTIATNSGNSYTPDQQADASHELKRREEQQGNTVTGLDTLS